MTQVVTDPFSGHIYVVWQDYANDRIMMSKSDQGGAAGSWTSPEVAITDRLLSTGDDIIAGGTRATTIPQVRFNWIGATDRIGVIYHAWRDDQRTQTDIFFLNKNLSSLTWERKTVSSADRDQFLPGIDYDINGNWLVGFMDRSGDTQNINYEEAWVRIDNDGDVLGSGKVLNVVATNPTNNREDKWVGDYQETTFWDFPNDAIGARFMIVYPMLDNQGEMHISGVH